MQPTQPCVYAAYGVSTKASAPASAIRGARPKPRPTSASSVALAAPHATSTAWNSIGVSNRARDSAIHVAKVSGRYWNAPGSAQPAGMPACAKVAHCNSSWL